MKKIVHWGLFALTIILVATACNKDDEPTKPPTPVEENNAPTIEAKTLEVAENIQSGAEIGTFTAQDTDGDELTFTLTGDSPFTLSKEGKLTLAEGQVLDYETTNEYELNVGVSDGKASASATMTLTITDVNEPPVFTMESFQFSAAEGIDDTQLIGIAVAEDPDNDDVLSYTISENDNALFAIDPATGQITLAEGKTLDFEAFNGEDPVHNITVQVSDSGDLTTTVQVGITLSDGDEFPVFDEETYAFTVAETASEVGTVTATDPEGDNLTYSIAMNDDELFAIDPATGQITLAEGKYLDFEAFNGEDPLHNITVQATDTGNNMVQINVAITVTDVDEDPVFGEESYAFEVPENSTQIGKVTATDPQEGTIAYSIAVDSSELFEVDTEGNITVKENAVLDFEAETQQYQLTIEATDPYNNTVEVQVTITVTDVNEAPTVVPQFNFEVPEDITDTDVIGQIGATDPDEGDDSFDFEIVGNDLFVIDADGQIHLANGESLDFESQIEHQITVAVSDGELSTETQVTITVTNVNEAPEIAPEFNFEVLESINPAAIIGTLTATDPDTDDELTYEFLQPAFQFEIDANGQLSLADGFGLDYETSQQINFNVRVTDQDGLFADTLVNITVADSFADEATPFITTWQTTGSNEEIRIGVQDNYAYDFMVDWGDGTLESLNFTGQNEFLHTYENPGTYTVAITGNFPVIRMENIDTPLRLKLQSIEQWGNIQWQSMGGAFSGCQNMVYDVTDPNDVPDLSQVTTLRAMFENASSFDGDFSNWDTGNVTNMREMFSGADSFTGQGLQLWDTGNVSSMFRMFESADNFDANLGGWDISSLISAVNMFDNSGMSPENYGLTLQGWSVQPNTPQNVTLGAANVTYCDEYGEAQGFLVNNDFGLSWTITDAGSVECFN